MESSEYEPKLECPFTWDDIITIVKSVKQFNAQDDVQHFPLVMSIHDVMLASISAVNGEDFESFRLKLEKCDKDLKDIEKKGHEQISLKVAQHVVQATKIHIFRKYGKVEESESLLQNMIVLNDDDMDFVEKGTLEACKSIAWSHHDLSKSIVFMRKAVKYNPKCDLWHLSLGTLLRRERRDENIQWRPSREEFNHFEKAFYLARNPFCAVMHTQALRENKNLQMAKEMYNKIYNETRADEVHILLKLALGFMQCDDLVKSKECLDRVAAIDSKDRLLYFHYQGMYHMKNGKYNEAVRFLEKAITDKNFGVEKQYLLCKVQADESFDATNYVLGMIRKYKDFPVDVRQRLELELATCYEKNNEDNKAVECFINAIKLNPKSSALKNFDCCVNGARMVQNRRHVYNFLKEVFLTKIDSRNIPNADTLKELVNNNYRY